MPRYNTAVFVLMLAMLVVSACTSEPDTALQSTATPNTQASMMSGTTAIPLSTTQKQADAVSPYCSMLPTVSSKLPSDATFVTNSKQNEVNCFAWQSFIALNWPAGSTNGVPDASNTAQDFGTPGDTSLTVWQKYKAPEDVFLSGAATPQPWTTPDQLPSVCAKSAGTITAPKNVTVLRMISKFGNGIPNSISDTIPYTIPDTLQASGQILVDQAHNLVRYEKRINESEFDYIVNNKLYDAGIQVTVAMSDGIQLPDDAIEIKAAWRVLEGQPANITNRYKTTYAYLYDPRNRSCSSKMLMGLVGLHILRKTPSMQQLMWSTFEQIDNVPNVPPSTTLPQATPPYSFNNPNCQLPDPCATNAPPSTAVPSTPTPTLEPVQVTRRFPIPEGVQTLNTSVQQTIQQARKDSVWQYYQLIDVLWPKNSRLHMPGPNATIPSKANIAAYEEQFGFTNTGQGQPLSNITMETYVQQNNCLNCHARATISQKKCNTNLASDFSFIFRHADTSNPPSQIPCPTPSPTSVAQADDVPPDTTRNMALQCLGCHSFMRKP